MAQWSAGLSGNGLTPAQIAHAYGFDKIQFAGGIVGDGSGQTIAIIDELDDPKMLSSSDPNFASSDLHLFDLQFGIAEHANFFQKMGVNGAGTLTTIYPAPSGSSGWSIETSMDVEWAHALAPGANIVLIEANSDTQLITAILAAANLPGVSAVSMSFGAPESSVASLGWTPAFEDIVSRRPHVTFIASSGDQHNGEKIDYPSTSPFALSVGGTAFYGSTSPVIDAAGDYVPEMVWNESFSNAAGGGLSSLFAPPSWQPAVTGNTSARSAPDVSFHAYGSCYVYDSYDSPSAPWMENGGTSASAPSWAALLAIANQGWKITSGSSYVGLGYSAIASLYQTYTNSQWYSMAFHDVTVGNNNYYPAGAGYDLATGLGTPKADVIAEWLGISMPAPTLSSPVNGATTTSTSPVFRWAPVAQATSYSASLFDNTAGVAVPLQSGFTIDASTGMISTSVLAPLASRHSYTFSVACTFPNLANGGQTAKSGSSSTTFTVVVPSHPTFTGGASGGVAATTDSGAVYVGSYNGLQLQTTYWAALDPGADWQTELVGDFNGDGRLDIAAMTASGAWYVGLSTGRSFAITFWGAWNPAAHWQSIQVGDFDGDGKADVFGRAANGDLYVAVSGGSSFNTAYWASVVVGKWDDVLAGDFNGDGKSDIAARYHGQWWVGTSTGRSFSFARWGSWSDQVVWDNVMVGDINGDGMADIVGRGESGGTWYVAYSTGTAFNTQYYASWSPEVLWSDVQITDLTGDGKADILGRTSGAWYVTVPSSATGNTTYWGSWSDSIAWNDVQVCDVNGDGKADIIGRTQFGTWYAAVSTGSGFNSAYLGGWDEAAGWQNVVAQNPPSTGYLDNLPQAGMAPYGSVTTNYLQGLISYQTSHMNYLASIQAKMAGIYDVTPLIHDAQAMIADMNSFIQFIAPVVSGQASRLQMGPGIWIDSRTLDLIDRDVLFQLQQGAAMAVNPIYNTSAAVSQSILSGLLSQAMQTSNLKTMLDQGIKQTQKEGGAVAARLVKVFTDMYGVVTRLQAMGDAAIVNNDSAAVRIAQAAAVQSLEQQLLAEWGERMTDVAQDAVASEATFVLTHYADFATAMADTTGWLKSEYQSFTQWLNA